MNKENFRDIRPKIQKNYLERTLNGCSKISLLEILLYKKN